MPATAPATAEAKRAATFEREVVSFAGQLRAFIRARISDPSDAEDVASEVFLKVFRGRGTLRDPAKLNAWLYRTARSAIIDHYRKRRPSEAVPANLAAESGLPDDLANRLQRSVRRYLATLPEAYRRPLELAEVEGLTARAVAAKLGLTETAAKSRVARGRAMLRKKLTQCCKFEFDPFGKIVDFQQRAPCACLDDDPPVDG
jgi:RNA polymerase sigma-70 factor (ECF subfamily)